METLLIALVLASALAAFIAAIFALRAGLKLHRTRAVLRSRLSPEVTQLVRRATELEKNLVALDARAQALPVRVSELQQNLAALRVLTNALGVSLRQAEKLLSFTSLKSSLSRPLVEAFGARTKRNSNSSGRERKDMAPRP